MCFFSINQYEIIFDEIQLTKWLEEIKKVSSFSFNIKTENIDNICSILGLAFAIQPGVAMYIPIRNSLYTKGGLSCENVFKLFKPIFEDETIPKIGEDLKYSYSILRNYGIELRGAVFDIMLESYILDSTTRYHSRGFLAQRWLKNKNYENISSIESKIPVSREQIGIIGKYAAKDVDIILQLHHIMWQELKKHRSLLDVFQNIEMPLVSVLSRIERNGVKIDLKILKEYSAEIAFRLVELKKKAHAIAGESFNLISTKQLQKILFEKEDIKPVKKTLSGMISTAEEVLEELSLVHSLPKIILEYRKLKKIKSTYVDKLLLMTNPKTERIHTSYHQTVTITGRLSSTDPNLQNIPSRDKKGRRIRQAFIAPKDYIILSADYSQIELRIIAHFSCDQNLLIAFSEGNDIHCITASEIFGLPLENVTAEQRHSAKIINFGLIYGMSAFGISRQLNISLQESKKYMNLYFDRYPRVLDYIKYIRAKAKKKGYVETLIGRRLYLPDITSNNRTRRIGAERAAVNAPIQGTAADIIKRAMIIIDAWLEKEQLDARMIMQVHDELVFEVHKEYIGRVSKKIQEIMESSMKLNLPLLVKLGIGKNWEQAHKN